MDLRIAGNLNKKEHAHLNTLAVPSWFFKKGFEGSTVKGKFLQLKEHSSNRADKIILFVSFIFLMAKKPSLWSKWWTAFENTGPSEWWYYNAWKGLLTLKPQGVGGGDIGPSET